MAAVRERSRLIGGSSAKACADLRLLVYETACPHITATVLISQPGY